VADEKLQDLWDFWYKELHDDSAGLTLRIPRILESTESEFQRIDVVENRVFGKLLVLYGSLMVADNDYNAYNEMITHVPLFAHPNPERVLIIGGGDCGALTEAMKHPEVKECTMCELDEKVVETAKKHFPRLTDGLSDPRCNLVFQDGRKFLEDSDDKYDVIILDLSDPIGPAADLFQASFHQTVYDRLNEDGILVAQSESPFFNQTVVKQMYRNLNSIFPVVRMYTCFMPIYPSGYWSFAFCSRKYDPVSGFDKKRWDKLGLTTRYYNDETHIGAFALPKFVRDLID
jgi:spermidine synthase